MKNIVLGGMSHLAKHTNQSGIAMLANHRSIHKTWNRLEERISDMNATPSEGLSDLFSVRIKVGVVIRAPAHVAVLMIVLDRSHVLLVVGMPGAGEPNLRNVHN